MLIGQWPGRKYRQDNTSTSIQEVEVGQEEQENSGKEESHSLAVLTQPQKKQDVTASPKRYQATWLTYTRIMS